MDNIFRKMTINDLEQIMKIERSLFSNHWSKDFFIETIEKDICYVNCLDNELIGYFVGKKISKVFYIMNFAIKISSQNKGFGTQMMSFLLFDLMENNFSFALLEVRESNVLALNLYKHFGFSIYQKKENYYSSPNEDAIQMFLNLKWYKKI
jgi:[ribosomal protein S18]-alanine N-acetyltransferase